MCKIERYNIKFSILKYEGAAKGCLYIKIMNLNEQEMTDM